MNAVRFPSYGPSAFPVASVVVLRTNHRPYLPPRSPPTGHWPHPCSSGQASAQSDLRQNTMAGPARRWSCLRGCTPVSPPPTACAVPPERCALLPAPAAHASTRGHLDSARARSNPCHRRRPPRAELGAAASSSAGPKATHCP